MILCYMICTVPVQPIHLFVNVAGQLGKRNCRTLYCVVDFRKLRKDFSAEFLPGQFLVPYCSFTLTIYQRCAKILCSIFLCADDAKLYKQPNRFYKMRSYWSTDCSRQSVYKNGWKSINIVLDFPTFPAVWNGGAQSHDFGSENRQKVGVFAHQIC